MSDLIETAGSFAAWVLTPAGGVGLLAYWWHTRGARINSLKAGIAAEKELNTEAAKTILGLTAANAEYKTRSEMQAGQIADLKARLELTQERREPHDID